jgi:hypothetical protein
MNYWLKGQYSTALVFLRNNKIGLYKTLIKPILCYGSVTWTLTQMSEQMLNASERKILQKIYGPTHEGGCWRPRWNNKLYSLYWYRKPNIVEYIKIRRLEWAAHITRMEKERIPKKVPNGNFHTTWQWEDQELDGQMWFRGMHYNCWGQEDGREELQIEMNGGVL